MRLSRQTFLKLIFAVVMIGGLWLAHGVAAQAGPDTGLNFASQTGLGNVDPRVTVARVIRYGLGLLGVLAVAMLIYAAWLWMQARGDEEKIQKAKKIIRNGLIGLAIILASFGIVSFILGRLLQSTGGGGNNGGVCSPACSGQTPYCCNGSCSASQCSGLFGGADLFALRGSTPGDGMTDVPRNTVIRLQFTKDVMASSVNAQTLVIKNDDTVIEGERKVIGDYIEFRPKDACPGKSSEQKCFPENVTITVEAQGGTSFGGNIGSSWSGELAVIGGNKDAVILSTTKDVLSCGTKNSKCSVSFSIGTVIDTDAPRVNLSSQQICVSPTATMGASAIDNYGISKIDFYVANNLVGSRINDSFPFVPSPYSANLTWDASKLVAGQNVTLKATAYDLDSNNASTERTVRISAGHCCNGIKDGDETAIDCGGSCLACNGQSCKAAGSDVCSNDTCQSGYCDIAGCSCAARPQITSVTPAGGFCTNDVNKACRVSTDCTNSTCNLSTPNGASGNLVTISGSGFGATRGKVFFMKDGKEVQAALADDSQAGNPLCTNNVWNDTQIIAVVPAEAGDGVLTVESAKGLRDRTDDQFGSLINNFKKNTINRPGICSLTPSAAKLNDQVGYFGVKMALSEAYFGSSSQNLKALVSDFDQDKQGTAIVPNLESGQTTTYISKGTVNSNFIAFTKQSEPYNGPIISAIIPTSGPIGQYVTLVGSGFGGTRGTSKVYFGQNEGTEADYAFPEVCAASVWTDTQIIIKVPAGMTQQEMNISVTRDGFPAALSADTFKVTTGFPNPGFCRIDPIRGQANSAVTLYGEYFNAKDGNSKVRFNAEQDQAGNGLTFWDIDEAANGIKPWKVITTVPQSASTGPVNVIVGTPAQLSNPLNFGVGACTQDADCGSGSTCCAAGLPEAGKCKSDSAQCYGLVATSVFQWRFSTNTAGQTCAGDLKACGRFCCQPDKCDASGEEPVCAECRGQNQCGNGDCCNLACAEGPNGGDSYCPDPPSCAGYNGNMCVEGYICPNVPGMCSPTPATGNVTVTGECGTPVCNGKPGCEGNSCSYNSTLNRCVKNGLDSCSLKELKDANRIVIKVNNAAVGGTCVSYGNKEHWQISMTASCPAGWVRLPGNKCVDTTVGVNPPCSICGEGQNCISNNDKGTCVIGDSVCASGSKCDLSDNKCKTEEAATCACCCRKDQAQQDCCGGLECGGSCGSGNANLGMCGGCAVRDENGKVLQTESDAKCICANHTGQFCSVTDASPTGVCTDCTAISDPAECSKHTECCVDAKSNNKCTAALPLQPRVPGSLTVTQDDESNNTEGNETPAGEIQFCAYFDCTRGASSCNPLAVKNGFYNKFETCETDCVLAPVPCSDDMDTCSNPNCAAGTSCNMAKCTCEPDYEAPGDVCRNQATGNCTLTCTVGYQCISPITGGSGGSDTGSDPTCRCCCKPPAPGEVDTCKALNERLNCIADQDSCKGPNRGACCGCTADSQCGDPAVIGCGLTGNACCRARPAVEKRLPEPGTSDVCRNTTIEGLFNQLMDKASFSTGIDNTPNVMLIGDFETSACPNGYNLIARAETTGRFASIIKEVKTVIAKAVPFLLTKPAFADISNYCEVPGTPVGTDVDSAHTKVNFRLTRPLEPNRNYYVVLKGDPALTDIPNNEKPYYNDKIMSATKIGLNALGAVNLSGYVPKVFNHTEFKNADIWTFKTGEEICQLESAKITPSFYLFQKSGQFTDLVANGHARNGQAIDPISGVYDWSWKWESLNSEIVKVEQQTDIPTKALATAGNKQDAQTLGKATATVTVDTVFQPSTVGKTAQGSAQLRLFFCENPWPVYPPFPTSLTWPWKDETTGIEFYYCRDKDGQGTADDLPALQNKPVNNNSGRKICMSGANQGRACSSNTDCGNASCYPEILKEFFFFRDVVPAVPVISGRVEASGGRVTLTWPAAANAEKYKVYYGFNPGQYSTNVEVAAGVGTITKEINSLVNGVNYYFAVTSLTEKNQETAYSNELKLKPVDTLPPAPPAARGTGGDRQIALYWAPVPDAVRYIAYIGTQPKTPTNEYAYSQPANTVPAANTPNIIFTSPGSGGLNNDSTYYLSVRSIDRYGNISDYSPELTVKPNRPYIISGVGAAQAATLTWLPFPGATSYVLSYENNDRLISVTVGGSTFSKSVSGLESGTTYAFTVKASRGNVLSDASNIMSVTTCSGAGCDPKKN